MRCLLAIPLLVCFLAHAASGKDARPTSSSRLCLLQHRAFSSFELAVLGSRRIGEVAAGRVRSPLLGHIPPAVEEQKAAVLKSVRRGFKGETRFAEDCLRVNLIRP